MSDPHDIFLQETHVEKELKSRYENIGTFRNRVIGALSSGDVEKHFSWTRFTHVQKFEDWLEYFNASFERNCVNVVLAHLALSKSNFLRSEQQKQWFLSASRRKHQGAFLRTKRIAANSPIVVFCCRTRILKVTTMNTDAKASIVVEFTNEIFCQIDSSPLPAGFLEC